MLTQDNALDAEAILATERETAFNEDCPFVDERLDDGRERIQYKCVSCPHLIEEAGEDGLPKGTGVMVPVCSAGSFKSAYCRSYVSLDACRERIFKHLTNSAYHMHLPEAERRELAEHADISETKETLEDRDAYRRGIREQELRDDAKWAKFQARKQRDAQAKAAQKGDKGKGKGKGKDKSKDKAKGHKSSYEGVIHSFARDKGGKGSKDQWRSNADAGSRLSLEDGGASHLQDNDQEDAWDGWTVSTGYDDGNDWNLETVELGLGHETAQRLQLMLDAFQRANVSANQMAQVMLACEQQRVTEATLLRHAANQRDAEAEASRQFARQLRMESTNITHAKNYIARVLQQCR